jgi:hypothetical protein
MKNYEEISIQMMVNDIRDEMSKVIHSDLNSVFNGYTTWESRANTIEAWAKTLYNISNFQDVGTIKKLWTEYCSDAFFKINPKISDVIMVTKELNGEALDKVWVCRNVYLDEETK